MRLPIFTSATRRLLAAAATLFAASATAQTIIAIPGTTAVGKQSQPVTVTLTMAASGTSAAPQALTAGVSGKDFVLSGGSCAAGAPYNAGQQCTANVAFAPLAPGQRNGAVVLLSADGRLLASALLTAKATGSLAVLSPGVINTVVGDGDWIYHGDGQAPTSTPIFLPTGVTSDPAGNLFVADSNNNRIRRVDAVTDLVSTYAGSGTPGYSGDGGAATQANVSLPAALVLDGAGNLYFADSGNHVIRRVDAVTGIITTVAGLPTQQGYAGDGAAATSAKLSLPNGIAFDAAGDLYIADTGNNRIRRVDAVTGIITTVAGTGTPGYNGDGQLATAAMLSSPWNLCIGPDNSIYIADFGNNRIRRISPAGIISTVAGNGTLGFSGDGSASTQAQLDEPAAVVLDPAGNLYIADSGNNRVREIGVATGNIQTICGTSSEEFSGDSYPSTDASLYGPNAILFDQNGDLLIADMFHNRIREISAYSAGLDYDTIRVGKVSPPQPEGLVNDGNAALNLTAPTLVDAELDPATTTCTTASPVSVGGGCTFGIDFAPTTVGNPVIGSVTVNSDAGNTPPMIELFGDVLSVEPTAVALTSSANPSLVNAAVTFTATVSTSGSALTGQVVFLDGTNQLCTVALSNGAATCTTSALALGQHNITASYGGDANDASSVSPVLVQVVKQTATLALSATPNPVVVTNSVSLTVTATAPTGTPTGGIIFYDGTTALGSANLNTFGVATFTATQLSAATHILTAQYAGDATNAPATSNTVSEVVNLAATLTTLASSAANAPVGTPITFTASLTSSISTAPTGTVTFTDGATQLGTATLSTSGAATLQWGFSAAGTHHIVATYSGDEDNAASTSTPLTETIQTIATTTVIAVDVNPANAGATIHLTGTVALAPGASADGVLSGQITFSDGATVLGTVSTDVNGAGVLALSTLGVGTHSITAAFSGSANYAASTSSAISEVINSTASTTVLTSSNQSALAGEPVTFTATVSTSTGTPTGTLTFRSGAATLGTATLNAQGVVTLTTSSLAVGNDSITAVYAGDSNYTGSTSTPLAEAVSTATPALALAGPGAPVNAGTTTTLTGTLTSNGITPTGSITLRDGGAAIATQTVPANGTFTFTSSTLSVGTHLLSATYAGDADNAAATSNTVTVVIQQAATTTTLASSANPQIVGKSVTLTASVTSTGPDITGSITFQDGGVTLGSVALANGTATYTTTTLAYGLHTLTAVYSGDTGHAASTSPSVSEQIVQAATASLASSLNPSISGTNVAFTAVVAGVNSVIPTGSIVFTDGAATFAAVPLDATGAASFQTGTLSVGSHNIVASYAGDAHYSTATATLIQTVQNASTQIVLSASANPATYGSAVALTAAITSDGGIATGSVTFSDSGTAIGSAVLNAQGVATLTVSTLAPGSHNIVANYAGDGKASASSSTPLTVVVKQTTQTTLASSTNPALTLSPITLSAAVANSGVGTASGTITFTDGSAQLGTATLDTTGHASLIVPSLSAGSHVLHASYAGDGSNFSSTSAQLTQTVQLRSTTTAVTASQTNAANPLQVTLIAVVESLAAASTAPTGNVTFSNGNAVIGTSAVDATGVATLTIDLQANTESITAAYGGDTAYAPSNSSATTVTAGPATQFTMTLSPASVSIQSKQHIVVNLTLSSVQNFADTMQLGCVGLPTDATCTFSAPQAALTANGSTTVQLTIDTGDPLGAGSQASLQPQQRANNAALLCALPLGLLAGLGLFKRRHRRLFVLMLLACAVTATFGLSGCGGLQVNGTPPGTYTFKVSAAGVGTGATGTQVMTLTVTQ